MHICYPDPGLRIRCGAGSAGVHPDKNRGRNDNETRSLLVISGENGSPLTGDLGRFTVYSIMDPLVNELNGRVF